MTATKEQTLIPTQNQAQFQHGPFAGYELGGAYDEMFTTDGTPRPQYQSLHDHLCRLDPAALRSVQQTAELSFLHQGITFTVYGKQEGTERVFPFDLLPRIISSAEWKVIERGLEQRLRALNLFLHDLYHDAKILKDRVVPRHVIYTCKHLSPRNARRACAARHLCRVVGSDLIRMPDGQFAVLEDNLRVPSGVSYMLANRQVMKQVLPMMLSPITACAPIDHYAQILLSTLRSLAPAHRPIRLSCC